jgi:hypothetical protein
LPEIELEKFKKREATILENIELWAARVVLNAWGWKNIDGWQRELLRCQDRYVIINATRQGGKSATLALKAFHTMLTVQDALVLIVAEQRQSNEDIRKVRELIRAYDKYLRRKYDNKLTLVPVSDNITSIELANGSRVIGLPGNEKVRGYSAPTMVVIDEAAYLPDEVFVGIDPMMEVSQGQLIIASTPNGTGGFFAHEWHNPRYTRFEIPWRQCPRISPESIEQKRMTIGEAYVKQEYECVFLDELTALFTEESLRASLDDTESVFANSMEEIQRAITGEAQLI